MKISVKWLNEYVSTDGFKAEELADKITNSGLEIESVEPISQGTNLTIGEVLTCEDHPDSDHLHITTVNVGKEVLQIVCGAPNVAKGQKVIVAQVGAKLPDGEIKAGKIRGVESNGMICSLLELGVDKKMLAEHQINGIEVLDENAPVGHENPLAYLGLDDTVLDAKQTPNRADCMAMWSVAKEVGAVLDRPVTLPQCDGASQVGEKGSLQIISKTDKCPHFLGKIVNHVKVGPSPKWMSDHLHAAGIKSINNVVDISNYVMLETGQPLHFYDLAKMPNKEITVVDDVDMVMEALDGVDYKIRQGDLLITTGGRPTGIAGIMGGDDSKIDESTQGIIIEAAHFNHVSIRRTANRLGLATEAATRFIKGIEPLAQQKAMDRAVQLLTELAQASGFEETVEAGHVDYQPIQVKETLTHVNQLLGTHYTMDEVLGVLNRLDLCPVVKGDEFICTIPSYRTDLVIREDLDEEIIRLLGYDSLENTLPNMEDTSGQLTRRQSIRRSTRQVLSGLGLHETVTYSLVKEAYLNHAVMPLENPVSLASPLSEDRKYVRTGLMASMLECLSYNQARKATNVNLFEISNVYGKDAVQERLGIVLTQSVQSSRLQKINVPADFYTLKGILLSWLEKLGFSGSRLQIQENTQDTTHFHPYRSAVLTLQREVIAIFGEVHPKVQKEFGVSRCVYAEVNLDALVNAVASKVKFVPLEKFPSVSRDIALVVKQEITAGQLISVIEKVGRKFVKSTEVFDVYQGEHVEQGYKSVALNVVYQSNDHTLTEEEITKVHTEILAALEKQVNAVLRG